MNSEMVCTGEYWKVLDGRKSFPSGHSSFSFATLGFLSFYLMGKLKVFSDDGRGKSYNLLICFLPLITAMLIGMLFKFKLIFMHSVCVFLLCSDITHMRLSSLEGRCHCWQSNWHINCLYVLPSILPTNFLKEIKSVLRHAPAGLQQQQQQHRRFNWKRY
jgi:PAP2 superfamily